jgi:Zn-dependent protease
MNISPQRVLELVMFFPLFMIAIMFHEVAHAYAALKAGDATAKLSGRLSLNPMVHIDPIGLLFFVLSSIAGHGFGWAKPVPVNPMNFKNYKRDDIIVSLAGVAANLVLMFLTLAVMKVLYESGIFDAQSNNLTAGRLQDYVFYLLKEFYFLNGILFVFNLLPIPPLDGSHVFIHLFFKDSMAVEAKVARYGFLILFGVLITGVLSSVLNAASNVLFTIAKLIINM